MTVTGYIGRALAALGARLAPMPAARLPAQLERTLAPLDAGDRSEFLGMYGGGRGAHAGAQLTRMLGDWQPYLGEPNDDWRYDAAALAARAWDLVRNDPHAQAMVATVVRCVYGSDGLTPRSLYRTDDEPDTDDSERAMRRRINACLARASSGTRLDACGRLSRRDLGAQALVSMMASGDGVAARVWKPGRPDAYQGQCWRIIAPERVSTPDGVADSDRLRDGIEYDDDGAPVALMIRMRHPASRVLALREKPSWERFPLWSADGRLRNVLHVAKADNVRPGQMRGLSWFAPLLVLARNLQKTAEAFVVAKRMQACNPAVLKTDNVDALAAAAVVGAELGPNLVWRPGMVAVTTKDNDLVFPQWSFQGTDFKDFIDTQLRAFTAAWGYPMQFVLQQLTEANLASAQVALDQADLTSNAIQDLMTTHWERPIDQSILAEEMLRGRLDVGATPWDLATNLRYLRPRRPDANKQRTREAAKTFIELGGSRTTAFAEMGYDLEEEISQRAQDDQFIAGQGVVLVDAAAAPAAPAAPTPPQERA